MKGLRSLYTLMVIKQKHKSSLPITCRADCSWARSLCLPLCLETALVSTEVSCYQHLFRKKIFVHGGKRYHSGLAHICTDGFSFSNGSNSSSSYGHARSPVKTTACISVSLLGSDASLCEMHFNALTVRQRPSRLCLPTFD